jgi:hypothetical protein
MSRARALNVVTEPLVRARVDAWLLARRGLGIVLAALSILPVYRLLAADNTGLAGAVTVQMADALRDFGFSVLLLSLAVALVLARFWSALQPPLCSMGDKLTRLPPGAFALSCAVFAGAATFAFSLFALHGDPNLIDATSQLMQARHLASGSFSGPSSALGAFWHLQQSITTPAGWVSQYPPGHVVLLALGYLLGAVSLVGPAILALTVYFGVRTAELLFEENTMAARVGGVLLSTSPFLLAHAGAYMNHTSAALFLTLAIYFALRAGLRGRGLLLSGAALGALFTIRPLTALTVGGVLSAFVIVRGKRALALGWMAAGAAPFLILVGLYNAHFFGDALRFGYEAALGPDGALGFGLDPWGNPYGLVQAIAYTSAELVALNLQLLESAIPAVVVVALFVSCAPRLYAGDRLLLALALAPLLTHLFYWHHGLFMGPRMLNEYAPLWCLLFARAALALPDMLPERAVLAGYSPKTLTAATVAVGILAMVVLGPMRLLSYATPPSPARAALASVHGPALVFVHGSWEDRIGMRLAAAGMRLDSVETLLRQNSTCSAQRYADARAQSAQVPALDFERRSVNLPARRELAPGSLIREGADAWTRECKVQAFADRAGVIDPARLFLHAGLPGEKGAVIVARDLGPRLNATLVAQYPDRPAYLLHTTAASAVEVEPYSRGVAQLWLEGNQ